MAQKYKPSKRTRMRNVRLDFVWMRFSQQNKDDPQDVEHQQQKQNDNNSGFRKK